MSTTEHIRRPKTAVFRRHVGRVAVVSAGLVTTPFVQLHPTELVRHIRRDGLGAPVVVVGGRLHVDLRVGRRLPVDAQRPCRRQSRTVVAVRAAVRDVSATVAGRRYLVAGRRQFVAGRRHLEVVVGRPRLAEGRRASPVTAVHAVGEVVRLVVRREHGPLQRRAFALLRAARVPRHGQVGHGETRRLRLGTPPVRPERREGRVFRENARGQARFERAP